MAAKLTALAVTCLLCAALAHNEANHLDALILDSESTINRCEVDIRERSLELKLHLRMCKHELDTLNTRLEIVMDDITVMTKILKMTDCESELLQKDNFALSHCTDQCTKKSFIEFNHDGLQNEINLLQSSLSHDLMKDTFADLFEGIESLQSLESSQTDSAQSPIANLTKFSNTPGNSCNTGAPFAADKCAAKCTIKKSPQCHKLQERFLLINAGIEDVGEELLEEIGMLDRCEERKQALETEISNDEEALQNAQNMLAAASEKEATAGETARQAAAQNDQLNGDLVKQMKTCSTNYINLETETCALKKIRGELHQIEGR